MVQASVDHVFSISIERASYGNERERTTTRKSDNDSDMLLLRIFTQIY